MAFTLLKGGKKKQTKPPNQSKTNKNICSENVCTETACGLKTKISGSLQKKFVDLSYIRQLSVPPPPVPKANLIIGKHLNVQTLPTDPMTNIAVSIHAVGAHGSGAVNI